MNSAARWLASILAIFVLAQGALAGAQRQPQFALRIHPQTGAHGGEFSRPITLQHSGQEVHLGTMPLINERDIVSMMSFDAVDGSRGAYFKLDAHGTNLVRQHTFSQRGTFLFAFLNGRHILDLYIDRPVADGIITIPQGLTVEDIALLESRYPPIGSEGRKPTRKPPTAAQ